jgi:predicted Zn-dependent protease
MFILALVWLYLFIVELLKGLSSFQETLIYIIWGLFILEFILKIALTPRKLSFVKRNWITVIALLVPALRVLRILNALRILQSVRVLNSTRIIRAITSGKRFFSALKEAQGPQPEPEMEVGILIAFSKTQNKDALISYAKQLVQDVEVELKESTCITWCFYIVDATRLESDRSRYPSAFLDAASQRMAEGPYDLVTVITDVGIMSRKNNLVAGLSSSVTRIIVLSTRKLTSTGRNKPRLQLMDTRVRFNSAKFLLHQIGHLLGLEHTSVAISKIMGGQSFSEDLKKIPSFTSEEKVELKKNAKNAPDRELRDANDLETFIFHILMTFRHLKLFFRPLLKNRALLLPLSLPGLATAAVAPAIILIFTAEIWDVGLGMTNGTAAFFAGISIMLASFYLVRVQSLFLPRKEKRILTEHLAVANSVIYFSIFLACIGLFLLVGILMMVIELYVFPPDLMQTWPTLNKPEILLEDKIRLAVFISTVGVTTGALAGGLESRTLIQHLALFRNKE